MIFKRRAISPDWESVPWYSWKKTAKKQQQGFTLRAEKHLHWHTICWDETPMDGIFGHQQDYLKSKDITHFTAHDGEDLFLIDNSWFEFPDPPRWGLTSRLSGRHDLPWQHWGHFADIPETWYLE